MNIVIVGDEAARAGELELGQALADFGLDWNVRWIEPGNASLATLADAPLDVLVCQLDPGSSRGPALLSQVRDQHPEAVRILLELFADPARPPEHVVLPTRLVVRRSTRPLVS